MQTGNAPAPCQVWLPPLNHFPASVPPGRAPTYDCAPGSILAALVSGISDRVMAGHWLGRTVNQPLKLEPQVVVFTEDVRKTAQGEPVNKRPSCSLVDASR